MCRLKDDSKEFSAKKTTLRNSLQTSKHNSKRRPPVVVNTHPENQTTFSKIPIFPGDKSYSETLTKKNRAGKDIDF